MSDRVPDSGTQPLITPLESSPPADFWDGHWLTMPKNVLDYPAPKLVWGCQKDSGHIAGRVSAGAQYGLRCQNTLTRPETLWHTQQICRMSHSIIWGKTTCIVQSGLQCVVVEGSTCPMTCLLACLVQRRARQRMQTAPVAHACGTLFICNTRSGNMQQIYSLNNCVQIL